MRDRQVNLGCVVAVILWVITIGLMTSGTLVGLLGSRDHWPIVLMLVGYGLMFSAAAATASIRSYVLANQQLMRDAFELGQHSVTRLPARSGSQLR